MKNNNFGFSLLAISIFTFSLTAGSHTDYDDHGSYTDHFDKRDIERIIENCDVSVTVHVSEDTDDNYIDTYAYGDGEIDC